MKLSTPSAVSFASRMAQLRPSAIREILKTTEAPDVISFAGGLPAPELFPVETFQAAAQTILSRDSAGALQYGVTEGYSALRDWVAEHLRHDLGLNAATNGIVITQGSQQGLDLLAKVLIDPGTTVLVESPAYLGAIQAFQSYQARIVGLPSDDEGLLPDALENYLTSDEPRPRFLYLICNYQNPTGTSMSPERRRDVAELCARYQVLVVEDDPYGRLCFRGQPSRALASLSTDLEWVYLGSTSKILAPGLRVGWLATSHAELRERVVTAKQATDLHTGSFTQRLVYQLVSSEDWLEKHIATLCEVYGRRRDVMLAALQNEMPEGCRWTKPDGGLFLWATLPPAIDALALLKKATAHKVAFVPGAPFWVGRVEHNTLRLNFSNASESSIAEGIRRLGRLVRTELVG